MSEMVKIAVTYEMTVFDNTQQGRIELLVPKRLAGILVYGRSCLDRDVANRDLYNIINGIAHLQGYSKAFVCNIRYANSPYHPLTKTPEEA